FLAPPFFFAPPFAAPALFFFEPPDAPRRAAADLRAPDDLRARAPPEGRPPGAAAELPECSPPSRLPPRSPRSAPAASPAISSSGISIPLSKSSCMLASFRGRSGPAAPYPARRSRPPENRQWGASLIEARSRRQASTRARVKIQDLLDRAAADCAERHIV